MYYFYVNQVQADTTYKKTTSNTYNDNDTIPVTI